MTRRFLLAALGSVVLAAAGATAASAGRSAPADAGRAGARPDPSFGGGRGWVTMRLRGRGALAYAVTLTPSHRIVLAGQATTPDGQGQILVARYFADGRLDRSFGTGGIFTTTFPARTGPYIGLAVRPQGAGGKLLVAGGYGLNSMLLMRLTSAGRLDRSFGARHSGYTTVPSGSTAQSLAIGRGGAILIGGSNANANGRPMVVARLTRDGRLDPRFARGGIAQTSFWDLRLAASAGVTGLMPTSDGGVIGSGHLDYIGSDGHGSAGIFRLSSRGRLVSGFGRGGHVEVAFTTRRGGFEQWFPCAMTVDGRGRITVTGDGSAGTRAALLSARVTARGMLDRGFGAGGRVITPGVAGDNATTCGATVTQSGILTAGVSASLARLRGDGAPDRRFSRTGVVRIGRPHQVAVQAVIPSGPGAVVIAGAAGNDMYLARYLLGSAG